MARVALPVWPSRVVTREKSVSGTHCSQIVKKREKIVFARSVIEFKVKGKNEKRKELQEQIESRREGEKKRNGRPFGTAETIGELAEWHRLQRKYLNKLASRNGKGGTK